MQKGYIRDQLRSKRRKLKLRYLKKYSKLMCWRLLHSPLLTRKLPKNPKIMLFYPIGKEARVLDLTWLAPQCRYYLPRCVDAESFEVVEYQSASDFILDKMGIPAPSHEASVLPKEDLDLILVPGLGFDRNGYRIGYGKGYYDRFLKDFKGVSVGIAFEFQIMALPLVTDQWDVPVDYLLSERGLLEIKSSRR